MKARLRIILIFCTVVMGVSACDPSIRPGEGTLDVILSWAGNVLTEPEVEARLTAVDSSSNDISGSFVLDTSGEPNTATYSGSWPEGYYTLSLALRDGAGLRSRRLLAVHVPAADAAEGRYALNETNMSLAPILETNVGTGLSVPYTISFRGARDTIMTDESMTIRMILDPGEAPDGIAWYLDGAEIANAVDSASVTIGPDGLEAGEGHHWLDVLVRHDGTLSSSGLPLRVTPGAGSGRRRVADHSVVHELWSGRIPEADIQLAKETLRIAYAGASHSAQLTGGMDGLVAFADGGNLGGTAYSPGLFARSSTGEAGALHMVHGGALQQTAEDVAFYPQWYDDTVAFLEDPQNSEANVVMWAWCRDLETMTAQEVIDGYLDPMESLIAAYPSVTFVFQTSTLAWGWSPGTRSNLRARNDEIRAHCQANRRWLYDFEDIESYDPDGNYYRDKLANEACDYSSTGGSERDANWAVDWQNAHTEGEEWFSCDSPHSEPLNANMKAYAAWWLFVEIAKERAGDA